MGHTTWGVYGVGWVLMCTVPQGTAHELRGAMRSVDDLEGAGPGIGEGGNGRQGRARAPAKSQALQKRIQKFESFPERVRPFPLSPRNQQWPPGPIPAREAAPIQLRSFAAPFAENAARIAANAPKLPKKRQNRPYIKAIPRLPKLSCPGCPGVHGAWTGQYLGQLDRKRAKYTPAVCVPDRRRLRNTLTSGPQGLLCRYEPSTRLGRNGNPGHPHDRRGAGLGTTGRTRGGRGPGRRRGPQRQGRGLLPRRGGSVRRGAAQQRVGGSTPRGLRPPTLGTIAPKGASRGIQPGGASTFSQKHLDIWPPGRIMCV